MLITSGAMLSKDNAYPVESQITIVVGLLICLPSLNLTNQQKTVAHEGARSPNVYLHNSHSVLTLPFGVPHPFLLHFASEDESAALEELDEFEWLMFSCKTSEQVDISAVVDIYLILTYGCSGGNVCCRVRCLEVLGPPLPAPRKTEDKRLASKLVRTGVDVACLMEQNVFFLHAEMNQSLHYDMVMMGVLNQVTTSQHSLLCPLHQLLLPLLNSLQLLHQALLLLKSLFVFLLQALVALALPIDSDSHISKEEIASNCPEQINLTFTQRFPSLLVPSFYFLEYKSLKKRSFYTEFFLNFEEEKKSHELYRKLDTKRSNLKQYSETFKRQFNTDIKLNRSKYEMNVTFEGLQDTPEKGIWKLREVRNQSKYIKP
ncbi:hypothetical protein C0J52_25311 [Blattella germanica]|nr:hypothetical protein C0J52_25311 [Blattella germanica]